MFTPVLAKHSKNFSLQDSLAIGVDRMQRNFGPMRHQAELWQVQQISTATAKLIIYRAFIEGDLSPPNTLRASCTISTSSQSMRNSSPGQCGASRMPLPPR